MDGVGRRRCASRSAERPLPIRVRNDGKARGIRIGKGGKKRGMRGGNGVGNAQDLKQTFPWCCTPWKRRTACHTCRYGSSIWRFGASLSIIFYDWR